MHKHHFPEVVSNIVQSLYYSTPKASGPHPIKDIFVPSGLLKKLWGSIKERDILISVREKKH